MAGDPKNRENGVEAAELTDRYEPAEATEEDRNLKKLGRLREILADKERVLIYIQNNPDPDGLASALAFRQVVEHAAGLSSVVVYGGTIGRAENRALVKYLSLNMRRADELTVGETDAVALMDTQPATGNNSLNPDVRPDIVIDHHPMRPASRRVPFTDIRSNYGATSTILAEYLRAAGLEIETRLATALLYGIRSDTEDLGRDATKPDVEASAFLYKLANKRMLSHIERERIPKAYLRAVVVAIRRAGIYENAVISCLGNIDHPDTVAEMADLLLRLEDMAWSFCFGFHGGVVHLSMRTSQRERPLSEIMQAVVEGLGAGGGHDMSAGGQVRLEPNTPTQRRRFNRLFRKRFLDAIGVRTRERSRIT